MMYTGSLGYIMLMEYLWLLRKNHVWMLSVPDQRRAKLVMNFCGKINTACSKVFSFSIISKKPNPLVIFLHHPIFIKTT